jgi:hypothetical protein
VKKHPNGPAAGEVKSRINISCTRAVNHASCMHDLFHGTVNKSSPVITVTVRELLVVLTN